MTNTLSLPNASSIYTYIMHLSYDKDPEILTSIASKISEQLGYNALSIIPLIAINRFNRYDTTFDTIRRRYFNSVTEFTCASDSYHKYIKNQMHAQCTRPLILCSYDDLTQRLNHNLNSDYRIMIDNMTLMMDDTTNDRIMRVKRLRSEIYRKATDRLIMLVDSDRNLTYSSLKSYAHIVWSDLFDIAESLKDIASIYSIENRDALFVELMSISLLEPYHEWVIECALHNEMHNNVINLNLNTKDINQVIRLAFGEYDKMEIEYALFDESDLLHYLMRDYPSHSILCAYDDRTIYCYDSDDTKGLPHSIISNRTHIPSHIDKPIQSITDDIFCIFHSILAAIDIASILENTNVINLNDVVTTFEIEHSKICESHNRSQLIHIILQRIGRLIESNPLKLNQNPSKR